MCKEREKSESNDQRYYSMFGEKSDDERMKQDQGV